MLSLLHGEANEQKERKQYPALFNTPVQHNSLWLRHGTSYRAVAHLTSVFSWFVWQLCRKGRAPFVFNSMTSAYVSPTSYSDPITPSALQTLAALYFQELKGQQSSCRQATALVTMSPAERRTPEKLEFDLISINRPKGEKALVKFSCLTWPENVPRTRLAIYGD